MIDLDDVLPPDAYARVRARRATALQRHKAARRVDLGDCLCLLFEDRDTVLAQIQEVVYVEGRNDPTQIRREIDEYACLLPTPSLLTATLTIHAGPPEFGATLVNELRAGAGPITLELGGRRYPCVALQPGDPNPSPIHYIGFPIDAVLVPGLCSMMPAKLRTSPALGQQELLLPKQLRVAMIDTITASYGVRTPSEVTVSPSGRRSSPSSNASRT